MQEGDQEKCRSKYITYKLRNTEIFYNGIRIMSSYIMTGQNILIEKSKFEMASKDIETMYRLIKCFD